MSASLKGAFRRPAVAKRILIIAAVLLFSAQCAPLSGSAPAGADSGERRGVRLENFKLEGDGFSLKSDRLELVFCGESGGGRLREIRAEGPELRIKRSFQEAGFDLGGLFSREEPYAPVVKITDGAVFFKSAPPFFSEGEIFFGSLDLLPGQNSILLEAEHAGSREFRVCSLKTAVRSEDGFFVFPDARGTFAGGDFQAELKADPGKWDVSVSGSMEGVFLEELPFIRSDHVSGLLGLSFDFSGNLHSLSSFSGEAAVSFSEGDVSEIPLIFGLAPALLNASSRKNAVFREGEAALVLDNGVFSLDGVRLLSEDVTIFASGDIALDGKLDLAVDVSFTEEYMRRRSGAVGVLSQLLKICDYFIIRHRIVGTFSEPVYEPMPLPAITMLPLQVRKILGFLLPMRPREIP